MNPYQAQSPPTTFEQKLNIGFFFAQFPAATVMVFLRRRVGLRPATAGGVLAMALFLIASPLEDGAFSARQASDEPFPYRTALPPEKPVRPGWLGIFAAASLVLAGRQALARKREMRNGIAWHTHHCGIPVLSFKRFNESTVARLVDPALCILAGFAVWHWFSIALGFWLIFAGLALRFVEQRIYKEHVRRTLDAMDAAIDSEALSQMVEQFEQHPSARTYATEKADARLHRAGG